MRPLLLLALSLAAAGCIQAPDPQPSEAAPVPDAPGHVHAHALHTFDGRLTATPAAPVVEEFPFAVPAGTTEVRANLSWLSEAAALELALVSPEGKEIESGFAETPTSRALATVHPPQPGNWTLRVTAVRALDEAFVTNAVIADGLPELRTIEGSYEVVPRLPVRELARAAQSGGFAEINLILDEGASFDYSWKSSGPVYFNIHYHGEGGTERAVEETTTGLAGNFTAPFLQVFSLLWRNEGATPVTVDGEVEGVMREHSRTR